MTMTSRERFAAMLNHKTPDRMPVYPLVNSISRQSLGITYEEWTKDINKCAEAIIRTTDELELDCLCTLVDLSVEAADFGQELLYFKDKAACPDPAHRVVPTEGDYDKIPRIDPAKGKRMSEHVELCRKLVKARGKDKPVVAFVSGRSASSACSGASRKCSWICIPAPDEVKKGVEIVSDVLCDWIDQLWRHGHRRGDVRYAVRLPVDHERGDVGRVRGRLHDPHRRTRALPRLRGDDPQLRAGRVF